MIVNIYDVGHGFCGYVRDGINGTNCLFDCGYNEETGVHPVDEVLGYGPIGDLTIQNYDEDHIDGLPHLLEAAGPTPATTLSGNPSVSALGLLALKEEPYSDALMALVGLKGLYSGPPPTGTGAPGECSVSRYWNPYPTFTDTNNLSLVTFVHGPGYSLLFPGDLEKPGWKKLLENPSFRSELESVRIFVASHHGRESGYCPEVFDYCYPDVVVISDEPMQFDSQEHAYAQHARGIQWNGREIRRVLTTRSDGHLRIGPRLGFKYWITASAA